MNYSPVVHQLHTQLLFVSMFMSISWSMGHPFQVLLAGHQDTLANNGLWKRVLEHCSAHHESSVTTAAAFQQQYALANEAAQFAQEEDLVAWADDDVEEDVDHSEANTDDEAFINDVDSDEC